MSTIQDTFNSNPDITAYGFSIFGDRRSLLPKTRIEFDVSVQGSRAVLNDEINSDKTIPLIALIKTLKLTKNVSNSNCSYGLKHWAERHLGYISNGYFIICAIHCGLKYKRDGPNCSFNLSKK